MIRVISLVVLCFSFPRLLLLWPGIDCKLQCVGVSHSLPNNCGNEGTRATCSVVVFMYMPLPFYLYPSDQTGLRKCDSEHFMCIGEFFSWWLTAPQTRPPIKSHLPHLSEIPRSVKVVRSCEVGGTVSSLSPRLCRKLRRTVGVPSLCKSSVLSFRCARHFDTCVMSVAAG